MGDRESIGPDAVLYVSPGHWCCNGEAGARTRRVPTYRSVATPVSQVVDEHLARASSTAGAARVPPWVARREVLRDCVRVITGGRPVHVRYPWDHDVQSLPACR